MKSSPDSENAFLTQDTSLAILNEKRRETTMKRMMAIVAASLAVALTVSGCAQHLASEGWITLIDGNYGLENFNRLGGANWRAERGAIVADASTTKGASILVSKRTFKDFELYAEFWADLDTNSGLYIRCTDQKKVSSASAYEAQIWDKNPNAPFSTGALLPVASVAPIYKVGGRWNTYEIHAKGSQLTVKLNGVVTVYVEDGRYPSGAIGLQFNPNTGLLKWRKLLVREL
jgi:hypothetical protein